MADLRLSGMLASAVAKLARDKLVIALGDPTATTMSENMRRDLEELKEKMDTVAEVVGDADGRSFKEDAVREWLIRLEDAAYGIRDMVDELQANQWKTATEVHRPCLPIGTARKGRMREAKKELNDLLQDGLGRLAFRRDISKGKREQSVDDAHPITPPFADDNEDYIVGMDYIKEEIMHMFSEWRDSSRGLSVFAIVGKGGIGKTTLAKMVFSDTTELGDYARVWVTLGMEFDLKKIGNRIISQLSNKGEHQDSSDVELIMKRVDELLGGGNKTLVVLDNLPWHSDIDRLEKLKCMLGAGKEDRKVIVMVTTRSASMAAVIRTAPVYYMKVLNEEESWQLLNRKPGSATRSEDDVSLELKSQILRRCQGLPLAIHALGYTMLSKTPEEIRSVLNSDMWELDGPLHPALILSYQSMPLNLRLCFAYCAIFPRDHSILKDDLIHYWTALQLLEPSDRLTTTQLANRYIDMLLGMSFLQRTAQPSDERCAMSFTMHDLVLDLALSISSDRSIVLDETYSQKRFLSQKNRVRQAWLTNSGVSDPVNLSDILSARLAVLLFHGNCIDKPLSEDLFSSAKYLLVLDLRGCLLQKLPDSICQLRQLRHLNFSGSTRLVKLPDSFGNLTSVMHIDLSGCVGLKSLTESFGSLKNVVHVNLSGCIGLESLPESFGLLEKLEHLDLSSCSCLKQIESALGPLTSLQHLNLSHPCCYIIQHRFHLRELKDIWNKLINLRYLNLSMCLNPILCYLEEKDRDKYIACISGLRSLEHLDLSHNIFLFQIPTSLQELSQLETLNLFGCTRLKRIDRWMGENNCPKKLLVVSNCLGLETYQFVVRTDGGTKISNLGHLKDVSCKELEISCLEKVVSTEEAHSIGLMKKKKLQKLTLIWSAVRDAASFKDDEALLSELVPPQNLQRFELNGYSSEDLPDWFTSSISSHLPNLVEVTMVDIPSCSNLSSLGVLPNLQRLFLIRMAAVTRIVDAGYMNRGSKPGFQRLLHVTLDDMVNLELLVAYSSSHDKFVFPTLDEMVINKCPKLRFGDSLPKARKLVISDCDPMIMSPEKRGEHYAVEGPSSSTACTTSDPVAEVVIQSLHIRNCSDKIISPEIMKGHLSSLQLLCFSHCDSMTYLPEHVVQDTSLRELVIDECRGIKFLPRIIYEEKMKHYSDGTPSVSEEKRRHNYPLLRIRGCPELKRWYEVKENKEKLAHIQIIFEESVTSERDNRSQETSD